MCKVLLSFHSCLTQFLFHCGITWGEKNTELLTSTEFWCIKEWHRTWNRLLQQLQCNAFPFLLYLGAGVKALSRFCPVTSYMLLHRLNEDPISAGLHFKKEQMKYLESVVKSHSVVHSLFAPLFKCWIEYKAILAIYHKNPRKPYIFLHQLI